MGMNYVCIKHKEFVTRMHCHFGLNYDNVLLIQLLSYGLWFGPFFGGMS
jgi:hypothetical protein